ncbi:TetR/AcrR family transcriptional regulator [Turneriella parva]|uniref:Transcriptional regulator, TetR family n=1 Tax=Turneriella parva (strain ATCC BAA-1111 / DSM 21527 / NCTC 11395 / H) TaxID=869212 RepID=I4B527_TURPD|nr:TetR/AcrR family transcriptional regulator [Turneriella parva]AFM12384.1 transcriptional regulator, TetR family [Turneriella parva DSM 21527]
MGKKTEILTLANRELQEKGVSSLSFRELAAKLGIKSSSVHYYFAHKDDLIEAVADQYGKSMFAAIEADTAKLKPGKARLLKLFDLIESNLENRHCTAGILAAESSQISDEAKALVARFFVDLSEWLRRQLVALGKSEKQSQVLATVILSSIEGCLMMDSLNNKPDYLRDLREFVKSL